MAVRKGSENDALWMTRGRRPRSRTWRPCLLGPRPFSSSSLDLRSLRLYVHTACWLRPSRMPPSQRTGKDASNPLAPALQPSIDHLAPVWYGGRVVLRLLLGDAVRDQETCRRGDELLTARANGREGDGGEMLEDLQERDLRIRLIHAIDARLTFLRSARNSDALGASRYDAASSVSTASAPCTW